MKIHLIAITLMTAAACSLNAQTSGGGGAGAGASSGGNAGASSSSGAGTASGAANSAGQSQNQNRGVTPGNTIGGARSTTPGTPGSIDGRAGTPSAGAVGNGNAGNGAVDGTTRVNPNLQVGPGWQPVQPGNAGTNQLGVNQPLGIGSNITGLGQNSLGLATNRFGAFSNQFGPSSPFATNNLLPTGRTNLFNRMLQQNTNQLMNPPGGVQTQPLPQTTSP